MENQEEFEEKKPNIFIIVLAIFLIVLTLSYFLTNPTARSVFLGLLESSKLNENQLTTRDDIIINFSPDVLEELNFLQDSNKEKEFKACLSGEVNNKVYTINSIYEPIIFLQEYDKVVSEPCNKETLIDLHSHPLKHCLPSEKDILSFNRFKEKNLKALMVIMCEKDRFNVYS